MPMSASAEMLKGVSVLLLAGGLGTRIRDIHPDLPKPLVPAHGRPFLYWVTAYFARHGLRDFIYSAGYRGDQIAAWSQDGALPGLTRRTIIEDAPLGTGGALMFCLDYCQEWILVANGDSLCLNGLPDLINLLSQKDLAGGILGVYQADTSRYGSLEIGEDGQLKAFREKQPGSGYVNAGVYLFNKSALRRLGVSGVLSIEQDIIPHLLDQGRRLVTIRLTNSPFLDIGTPETVVQAADFIKTHAALFALP